MRLLLQFLQFGKLTFHSWRRNLASALDDNEIRFCETIVGNGAVLFAPLAISFTILGGASQF